MFCANCGKETAEGQLFCPYCGHKISAISFAPVSAGRPREKTSWEDRESQGFFGGLWKTLRDTLFSPTEFFKKMPVTGGLTDPLLYALIVGMVGLMFSYVWQILFQGMILNYLPAGIGGAARYDMFHGIGTGAGLAVMAVASPFVIIIWLFIWSGILHLFLMMVRGARAGFEATFRTVSYSYGTSILMVVPFCGGIIAWIWSLVLVIVGLKEAHETTGGKAALAALFPLLLCCGLIIFLFILFMGAIVASIGAVTYQ